MNALINWCRVHNFVSIQVASTGVAASVLDFGRTAHRGLGLLTRFEDFTELSEKIYCSIAPRSNLAKLIANCSVIFF